jgi:hypothetical protein
VEPREPMQLTLDGELVPKQEATAKKSKLSRMVPAPTIVSEDFTLILILIIIF